MEASTTFNPNDPEPLPAEPDCRCKGYQIIKDEDSGKWLVLNDDGMLVYGPCAEYQDAVEWTNKQAGEQ